MSDTDTMQPTSAGFDGQPEILADIMTRDAMAHALAVTGLASLRRFQAARARKAARATRGAERFASCFVVEFRSGSLFCGPGSDRGGSLGEAMRFQQRRHAEAYIKRRAPWAWSHGACAMPIEHATTAIANWGRR